jgi:hypothetical protein
LTESIDTVPATAGPAVSVALNVTPVTDPADIASLNCAVIDVLSEAFVLPLPGNTDTIVGAAVSGAGLLSSFFLQPAIDAVDIASNAMVSASERNE